MARRHRSLASIFGSLAPALKMTAFSRVTARIALIVVALIAGAGIYFWEEKGIRYYSVQSDSMTPAIKTGDLVIDKPVIISGIKRGDIVSYASLSNHHLVVSHRVLSINNQRLITKGDNLFSADPPVDFSAVQGRVFKVIPRAGYLLDSLKNPLGLFILVYIPVAIIAAAEFQTIYNRLRRPYKHPKLI